MSDLEDLEDIVIEPTRSGSAKRIRAGMKRAHGPRRLKPLWKRQLAAEVIANLRREDEEP